MSNANEEDNTTTEKPETVCVDNNNNNTFISSKNVINIHSILEWYNEQLEIHPVKTKALTSAVIQGLGAYLGSRLMARHRTRTNHHGAASSSGNVMTEVLAFAFHGSLIGAPVSHYWFEFLSKYGPKSQHWKMLIDQIVVQPVLLVVMFVFMDATKASMREIPQSLRRTLPNIPSTVINSWKVWPLAVYLSFRYLKKKHYTLALNICSLAWTVYLSSKSKHQKQNE